MRRIILFLVSILLISALCIPVWGENKASKIQITANVSQNESCQVTVVATMHVEENNGELLFPVPKEATGVTLNGSRVRTKKDKQVQNIDLTDAFGKMTGDFIVTIAYSLPDVIQTGEAGTPELNLPMLSGYKSVVDRLDFTVTMPGEIQEKPAFSSGYHKADIEKDLSYSVNGTTVVGFCTTELKDRETLTMTMAVDPVLFPNAPIEFVETNVDDIAMVVLGILAVLYWFLALRTMPWRWKRCTLAPEGATAGELGSILTLGSADLSLMVLSWAQLGYIQLQVRKNRVLLSKQMDMGNERSSFEQRYFRRLFEKRTTVDTGGLHYAILARTVAKTPNQMSSLVHPRSGNVKVFRAIAALIGLFGGVSFGIALTQSAVMQVFLIILLAVGGLVCNWFMQETVSELILRKSSKTAVGVLFSVVWLIIGLLAGQFNLAFSVLLVQWIAGLMAFYGGRRTEAGLQEFARILGLRRYLSTVSKAELVRISQDNPEYFHNLEPYALALGINRRFSRRFKSSPLPTCPYITFRTEKNYNAQEWDKLMNRALKDMNRRSRILPLERFLSIFASIRK